MPRKTLDLCFICSEAPCVCNAKPAKKAAKPRKRAVKSETQSAETVTPAPPETPAQASTNAVSMREAMKASMRPDLGPKPVPAVTKIARRTTTSSGQGELIPLPDPVNTDSQLKAAMKASASEDTSDLDFIRAVATLEPILHDDEKIKHAMELQHPAARAVRWRREHARRNS